MTTTDREADAGQSGTPLVEIIVAEDLTATAAVRLGMLLRDAIEMRPAQLVVDLSGCGYADAIAVQILLDAHRRIWHIGGRLTLRAPSARMQRLLRLAHLDRVFHVTTAPSPAPVHTISAVGAGPVGSS